MRGRTAKKARRAAHRARPPWHAEVYAGFVEHPRFGKAPRFTGLDPDRRSPEVHLHWNTSLVSGGTLVPGTAIPADLARQIPATVPVTHYYDLDLLCRDCQRRFIFFAEEQKHWYEELRLPLEAGAVRCSACRKIRQRIERAHQRHDELSRRFELSVEETMEIANCCLFLIEAGVFHRRQTEKVRMLLKRVPEKQRAHLACTKLAARLEAIESQKL